VHLTLAAWKPTAEFVEEEQKGDKIAYPLLGSRNPK